MLDGKNFNLQVKLKPGETLSLEDINPLVIYTDGLIFIANPVSIKTETLVVGGDISIVDFDNITEEEYWRIYDVMPNRILGDLNHFENSIITLPITLDTSTKVSNHTHLSFKGTPLAVNAPSIGAKVPKTKYYYFMREIWRKKHNAEPQGMDEFCSTLDQTLTDLPVTSISSVHEVAELAELWRELVLNYGAWTGSPILIVPEAHPDKDKAIHSVKLGGKTCSSTIFYVGKVDDPVKEVKYTITPGKERLLGNMEEFDFKPWMNTGHSFDLSDTRDNHQIMRDEAAKIATKYDIEDFNPLTYTLEQVELLESLANIHIAYGNMDYLPNQMEIINAKNNRNEGVFGYDKDHLHGLKVRALWAIGGHGDPDPVSSMYPTQHQKFEVEPLLSREEIIGKFSSFYTTLINSASLNWADDKDKSVLRFIDMAVQGIHPMYRLRYKYGICQISINKGDWLPITTDIIRHNATSMLRSIFYKEMLVMWDEHLQAIYGNNLRQSVVDELDWHLKQGKITEYDVASDLRFSMRVACCMASKTENDEWFSEKVSVLIDSFHTRRLKGLVEGK